MKKTFWKVQIEIYGDGTVKAAVLLCQKLKFMPKDKYCKDQWRNIYVLWFASRKKALEAVIEALSMNQEAAA